MGNKFGIRYLNPLGGIGVAIFLILSGYGINESYQKNGMKNFWLKRITSAYLPYLLIEMVGYLFEYKNITCKSVAEDLLLIRTLHPFGWYMSFIFLWYVIYFFINSIVNNVNYKCGIYLIISIILFFMLRMLPAQQAFSFILGVMISIYKEDVRKKLLYILETKFIWNLPCILAISILALKQTSVIRGLPEKAATLYELCMYLMFATYTIILSSKVIWKGKAVLFYPISNIGTISFQIYLLHAFTFPLLNNISYQNIMYFLISTTLLSSIFFLLCRYISIILKRYYE
jgi:Predicted acyltransferases